MSAQQKLFQLIDRLKSDNYNSVTDTDRTLYHKLLNLCERNNEFNQQLFNHLVTPTAQQQNTAINQQIITQNFQIAQHFDITQYYQKLVEDLSYLTQHDILIFFSSIKIKNNIAKLNAQALTAPLEMTDGIKKENYNQQLQEIFSQIITSSGKSNQLLAEINQTNPIKFKITESPEFDGHFAKDLFDKTEKLVISINSGCFSAENIKKLPMLISHECSHMIDINQRYKIHPETKNYNVSIKQHEEYVADSIGASLCANAGYTNSIEEFKQHLLISPDPFLQQRANFLTINQQRIRTNRLAILSGRKSPETYRQTATAHPNIATNTSTLTR